MREVARALLAAQKVELFRRPGLEAVRPCR
jgi:hypothetical protein